MHHRKSIYFLRDIPRATGSYTVRVLLPEVVSPSIVLCTRFAITRVTPSTSNQKKTESGVAPVGAIGGAFDPSDWVVLQHLLRKVECKEKRPSPEHSESGCERCGSNGDDGGGNMLPDGN